MVRGLILKQQLPWRGHLLPLGPRSLWSYPVLAALSSCYPRFEDRLPTCYSPVRHFTHPPKGAFSFDLHVLGTPPAFVLSQDQTLRFFSNIQRLTCATQKRVNPGRMSSQQPKPLNRQGLHARQARYSVFKEREATFVLVT